MGVGVSIVMGCHNRQAQILNTLDSFVFHKYKDCEIIIVDDCSDVPLEIDVEGYEFDIKIHRISPSDKVYPNPAYAYNVGIAMSRGRIIIVQNAECFHQGSVFRQLSEYDLSKVVLSLPCYSVGEQLCDFQSLINFNNFEGRCASRDYDFGWYNHNLHRPVGYHFCSVFSREVLNALGGFDPIFYEGIGFDDDDLVFRIKQSFNLVIPEMPVVIHQFHEGYRGKTSVDLIRRNKMIFELSTKHRIPKKLVVCFIHPLYERFFSRT